MMDRNPDLRWIVDKEYTELPLSRVTKNEDGSYAIERENDFGTLWIDDPGFEPKVGDMTRFYGRGTGFPVRGVVIAGICVRYQTAEELEADQRRRGEEFQMKKQEADARLAGRDERAMRELKAPWPKTIEELAAYVEALSKGPHTYGTCVYAASLSATAAFNFVCGQLGMTGFQASCADLDVVRRTRGIEGPFILLKAEDALYPQYDLPRKLAEAMNKWRPWLAEEAAKKLDANPQAHPEVVQHWLKLKEDR